MFVNDMFPRITSTYWTKDGTRIDISDKKKYASFSIFDPSLTIYNVNQHGAGTYRLTATNAVGSTSSEIALGNTFPK